MTHEPIHTVHLTPHITWQGTRAELEAMQDEGWPLVDARSERIKELLADARSERIKELEAKLAELLTTVEQAIETYKQPHYGDTDTELDHAYDAINLLCEAVTKLKGQDDE